MSGLTVDANTGNKAVRPGVFIDKCKILSAECTSGTTPQGFDKPIGIGVKLTIKVENSNLESFNFDVFGEPKRDAAGALASWGGAFVVKNLLNAVGGFNGTVGNDGIVPQEALNSLVGKEMFRLSYIKGIDETSGKKRYSTWKEVASVAQGQADLLSRWDASVAKGYPSNYAPSLVNGAPAVATAAPQAAPAGDGW